MSQSIRNQLIEYLQTLPEDVSIEEIMYHLYVKETVLQRKKECTGNEKMLLSEKEVAEEIAQWLR